MLSQTLTDQHRNCDDHFQRAEQCAGDGEPVPARQAWQHFRESMAAHFDFEEKELFPELDQATGMEDGPTAVMRMEHDQIRLLIDRMSQALDAENLDGFLDHAETLNILIQQHNMKEEQMLYPMCDQMLSDRAGELLEKSRGRGRP